MDELMEHTLEHWEGAGRGGVSWGLPARPDPLLSTASPAAAGSPAASPAPAGYRPGGPQLEPRSRS